MAAKVNGKNRTRIVIADDHTVLRESLASLLATQPDFSVEGRAANGQEALSIVQEDPPDVLLLDLFMPDGDGFEVLRTAVWPPWCSPVLTMSSTMRKWLSWVRVAWF
jgi:DNA-binding NarL/FixJ family response regulator